MEIKSTKFKVYDMTCTSCEKKIENELKKLNGVLKAKVSYSNETVTVEYDSDLCNLKQLESTIEAIGYTTEKTNSSKITGVIIIALAVLFLGMKTSGFDMEEKLTNASYAVLFLIGVLTSLHCMGMCGGIMLSQSLGKESKNKFESIKPALIYNIGRVISYTILGGIVGALGSVLSFSIMTKAGLQIFAGLFMIIMGFNMAGFSIFKKLNIKLPFSFCKVKNKTQAPFLVGILNGLMPCGPLQTMQLFALGTGSAAKGALAMFLFSLGTVPLMLTFGAISGILSKGYTKKILKFSGVLVIVLGLVMGNRGFALAGVNINPLPGLFSNAKSFIGGDNTPNANISKATIEGDVQVINMTANNYGYTPNAFYVQKGIPVKWVINGEALTSCNNAIVAQALNLEKRIEKGENIVEFTPGNEDINFSCWMGMIRGVIKVVDNLETVDVSQNDPSLPPAASTPSCCARPLDEEADSDQAAQNSIYGDDLKKIPTDSLVKKVKNEGEYQSFRFKGIGYELEPLIVVTSTKTKTKLTFDLSKLDNAAGEYFLVDVATGEKFSSFQGKQGENQIEFDFKSIGSYAIVKDNILGVIEVVEDINTTNLEDIRNKFLE